MRPRALCINPWIYDFAAYDLWIRPLGLLTIAGVLRQSGVEVSFLDCLDRSSEAEEQLPSGRRPSHDDFGCGHYRNERVARPAVFAGVKRYFKRYGISTDLFEARLESLRRPDVVLVSSGMTYWYPGVFDVIARVRRRWPDAPVVLGGVYAALCRDHALSYSGADFVSGASSLSQVLEVISEALGWKVSADPLDAARPPCPAYDLINHRGAAAVLTGRGCPYNCTYCASDRLEPEVTRFNPGHMAETIETLAKDEGVRDFAFYDDALLVNWETHLKPILEEFISRGGNVRFHTPNGLHARFVTREAARLLKRSGFRTTCLSYESADLGRQGDSSGKVTTDELGEALQALEHAGFQRSKISVYALMGLPGQSETEVRETVETIHDLDASSYLAQFSPIPGTAEFERWEHANREAALHEPLLHNNTAFPYLSGDDTLGPEQYQRLRDLSHSLNAQLREKA